MKLSAYVEHKTVYSRPGRFGGWPANYGTWSWGDEIVLVFVEGAFANNPIGHKRDKSKPFTTLQSRSTDGGDTWRVETFNGLTPKNRALSADEHMVDGLQIGNPFDGVNPPESFTGVIDFSNPEHVVLVARTTCHDVPAEIHSWFHVSRDRCRSWDGPFKFLGLDGSLHLAARTDVVPIDTRRALFLLTAHKSNGEEGRVVCAESSDGGRSYALVSTLRPDDPDGFEIMPASVRLPDGRILTAVRAQHPAGSGSIRLFESLDDGRTWDEFPPIVDPVGPRGSNPPALVRMESGRLCVVFGYRNDPFGIRARYSDDSGTTWSDDVVLRDDGGDSDIGYPRAVKRADGRIVAGYYFNTHTDSERFIGVTIWDAERE